MLVSEWEHIKEQKTFPEESKLLCYTYITFKTQKDIKTLNSSH